ncbi:hypothetical protein FB559_4747 [Actinoallomurus bryophytorum]|uniref:Uncharacterized protein n=1 Tax=Actinoallomurus bryophytorum TaxID=1490222 RepID=A0A543CPQ7_9ACTN|nr:hypothetical protein FB559_4747 [Actinoallomurus bryophytorum]
MAASLVTTLGSVLAALGGIGMTQGIGARNERRKNERLMAEERVRAHDRTCADLMAAARKLRLQIVVTAKIGRCTDMDVRLSAIQEQAAIVNQHASELALLAGDALVTAGRDLAREADELAGFVAETALMDRDDTSRGVLQEKPDLAEFEKALDGFEAQARTAQPGGASGSGRSRR